MRVIIATDLGAEWKGGHFIIKALRDIGVTAMGVDPLHIDSPLQSVVEEFKPDLILLTKGRGIDPETVEFFKKGKITLAMWYPDYILPESTLRIAKKMDFFFTPVEGMVPVFREMGLKNAAVLPQGFEPSFFALDAITDEDWRIYGSDVTFIGTLEPTELYRFRSERLNRIIKEGYILKWWGRYLSRKLKNIKLRMSPLGKSYGGREVYLKEFAKVVRTSKIFVALDVIPHVRKCVSVRLYMALGCGAFYLCQHVEGIEEIFVPDEEIVTFSTEDEMIDKIRYYLPREDIRKKIALKGQERVLKEHTYQIRVQQLLNTIGLL